MVSSFLLRLLASLSLTTQIVYSCKPDDGYSMYVWTQGFNASAPFCNGIYPELKTGDYASCWNHNWETPTARQHLWASTKVKKRKVTRIFLSDVKSRIEHNGYSSPSSTTCDADLVSFLSEAHQRGIKVYALFAVSNEAFSETYMAKYPNEFNTVCGTDTAYFDGVSVNNEYFSQVRSCDDPIKETAQLKFLTDLSTTAANSYPLPLHFSVSWNWECCDCSSASYVPRNLEWGGETKTALAHMIDIVDSVDVQVAYNLPQVMEERAEPAYQYWMNKANVSTTSRLYVLAYASPSSTCQTSFAPHAKGSTTVIDTCNSANRTEAGMFAAFDHVEEQLPGAVGGIHYMGGVFSTGMTDGWPKHDSIKKSCGLDKRYKKKKGMCISKCRKGKVWDWESCKCMCPLCMKKKGKKKACRPRCKKNALKWDTIEKECIALDSTTSGLIWSKENKECIPV